MIKLSIVIVNYNVKYFLRQCLQSIYNSDCQFNFEVIVVDNKSTDGSDKMVGSEFPQVKYIYNQTNVGFSKANNLGFDVANGEYILILNPDTILEEDTLSSSVSFAEKQQNFGALGVKMLDGKGEFLHESKRGFPTPTKSIFKLTGLSRLFSKSSLFNGYYLGHLSNDDIHKVDVLTGAFMLSKKSVLESVNGFDEDYFMYGEDIELSYQIRQLGKDIFYYPNTSIIHFKGESTKKSSVSYLKNFYGAMAIYANKRNHKNAWLWQFILYAGIWLAAFASGLKKIGQKTIWPLIDLISVFSITIFLQLIWGYFYFDDIDYYKVKEVGLSTFLSTGALILVFYILGHYDKKYSRREWLYAFVFGFITVMALYSLYPIHMRYSRVVLLALLLIAPFLLLVSRFMYNLLFYKNWGITGDSNLRSLVIGNTDSFNQVGIILNQRGSRQKHIEPLEINRISDSVVKEVVDSRNINEVVFCTKDISIDKTFELISELGPNLSYLIANNDNSSILRSDSKNTLGEWYTINVDFKLNQNFHLRTKRMLDLFFGIVFLLFSPLLLLINKRLRKLALNTFNVLTGNKTWVSYKQDDNDIDKLPILRKGVFEINFPGTSFKQDSHQSNIYYAKNYSVWMEIEQVLNSIFKTK